MRLRCHCNTDHKKFPSLSYKAVVAIGQIFVYAQNWEVKSLKNPSSHLKRLFTLELKMTTKIKVKHFQSFH